MSRQVEEKESERRFGVVMTGGERKRETNEITLWHFPLFVLSSAVRRSTGKWPFIDGVTSKFDVRLV